FPRIGWLESSMGIETSDVDAVKLHKVQQTLAPLAAVIDDLIPPVAALLSITNRPRSQHSSAIVNAREKSETTQQVIAQLVVEVAARRPVFFVIEDLHWIDPSTMELLDLLVEQTPSVPLLILATLRPGQAPAEWMSREYVSQVALDRVDMKEKIVMVHAVTGGKPLPAITSAGIVYGPD